MFITKSEISLEINFAYIEFYYAEVRLYRSNLEGPFDFDITGVDCIYIYIIKTRLLFVCLFVCLCVCPDCIKVMWD